MATVRRLSNQDVMNIFDCVHNNRAPIQRRLMFKIVVVGPHGMKLSPPSYQFEGESKTSDEDYPLIFMPSISLPLFQSLNLRPTRVLFYIRFPPMSNKFHLISSFASYRSFPLSDHPPKRRSLYPSQAVEET